jgi:hypothetical protein
MPKCPKATSTGTNWGTGRISEGAFFVPSYSEQTILHAYSTETTIQSFGFGDQVEGPKESDLQQSPDLTRGQGLGPRGAGRAPGKMAGMLAANSRIYDWCLEMEPGKGSQRAACVMGIPGGFCGIRRRGPGRYSDRLSAGRPPHYYASFRTHCAKLRQSLGVSGDLLHIGNRWGPETNRGQVLHPAFSTRKGGVRSSRRRTLRRARIGSLVLAAPHGCCARAASGQAAAPPSVAKNFRRPMWLTM